MKTLFITMFLLLTIMTYSQVTVNWSPTTYNYGGMVNVNPTKLGAYARIRQGDFKIGELSFDETYIGLGVSIEIRHNGHLMLGCGYYEISNIQGYFPGFNFDKLHLVGIDVGILVEIPHTPVWVYVNNDCLNWVLEIGIGVQLYDFDMICNKH